MVYLDALRRVSKDDPPKREPGRPFAHIKALAFDAYGTLFDVFSVTALCEQLFPGQGTALARLWRAKQLQYSLLRTVMGRYQDFWQLTDDGLRYAANSLHLDLSGPTHRQLMDAYLTLAAFPDVAPGLETLKRLGLRLAILSNGAPNMLDAATERAGIGALLDATISADALHVFKPSRRVYRLAQTRLKVAAGGLGFVSSNSWDISGAASAGLTTFWMQRHVDEPAEELGFPATRVVTSLADLATLLQEGATLEGLPAVVHG
jgi:2-haloacid dehalogenase